MRPVNFYYNVSGTEAERLLLEYGDEGAFVVRPSESNPENYTLSVHRGTRVTHVKIQKSGEYLEFHEGEPFASLTELVQHYMENPGQLKEKNGELINMISPLTVPATEKVVRDSLQTSVKRYFHANLSGPEAERLLQRSGKPGSYLVRNSQMQPGKCVISVRIEGDEKKVLHIRIDKNEKDRYTVRGGDDFATIDELLEHHQRNPLVDTHGNVVHLTEPIMSSSVSALNINKRIAKLEQIVDTETKKDGFAEEFEHLSQSDDQMISRKSGKLEQNVSKNRYKNIIPYDHTRVTLRRPPGSKLSDYINANYIRMLGDEFPEFECLANEYLYISTQGCLPETVGDLWTMVWQQGVRLVVMTTKEVERGRAKCHRYWPDVNAEARVTDEITVRTVEERFEQDYVYRRFLLTCGAETSTVVHLQFVGWPDHGCPSDPAAVLRFLEAVEEHRRGVGNRDSTEDRWGRPNSPLPNGGPRPVIVHCSAGIGRTGTFIVIDILLNLMRKKGTGCHLDIPRALRMVREQRSGMVQTDSQYRFIYEALAKHMNELAERETFIYEARRSRQSATSSTSPTSPLSFSPSPLSAQSFNGSLDQQAPGRIPSSTNPALSSGPPLKLAPPPLPKRNRPKSPPPSPANVKCYVNSGSNKS